MKIQHNRAYVKRCLLGRVETLQAIANGSNLNIKTLSILIHSKDWKMSTRTLNKLNQYFESRSRFEVAYRLKESSHPLLMEFQEGLDEEADE